MHRNQHRALATIQASSVCHNPGPSLRAVTLCKTILDKFGNAGQAAYTVRVTVGYGIQDIQVPGSVVPCTLPDLAYAAKLGLRIRSGTPSRSFCWGKRHSCRTWVEQIVPRRFGEGGRLALSASFQRSHSRFLEFCPWRTNESCWIQSWLNPFCPTSELAVEGNAAHVLLADCEASGEQHERVTAYHPPFPSVGDIESLCREGRLTEAIGALDALEQRGVRLHSELIAQVLQECALKKSLADGKHIHSYILRSGLESSPFLAGHVIRMYASCGRMLEARKVFDNLPKQKVFAWTALMKGYVSHGQAIETLKLFKQMDTAGVKPDKFIFVTIVNACARLVDLEEGKRVHAFIHNSGSELDIYVENALIDMYAKCGSIEDARQVFDKMQRRDVVSWNAIISGYARSGLVEESLKLYQQMQQANVRPNAVTFACVLNGCASRAALKEGTEVHAQTRKNGMDSDVFVGTALVDMYTKCGMLEEAFKAFCTVPVRGVFTWNAMLRGCVEHGQGKEALRLFHQMQLSSLQPDALTFVYVLKACASIPALDEGQNVHRLLSAKGFASDVFVGNALMDMYARFGKVKEAQDVFSMLPREDVASWNGMLKVYLSCGYNDMVLRLFHNMQQEGVEPDQASFVLVSNACGNAATLEDGRRLHMQITQNGLDSDVLVGTALADMYGKCGRMEVARQIFDKLPKQDVVLWNVMIKGYAQQGLCKDALMLYKAMLKENVEPDSVTFLAVLGACVILGDFDEGRRLHVLLTERGYGTNIVLANALIDMYARCGSMEDAYLVFDSMPTRDRITWNSMIKGYAQLGQGKKALENFDNMQQAGLKPDSLTFVSVLNGCASIAALEEGKQIHDQINASGNESDISVGNCLLDMYVKCGDLFAARHTFEKLVKKDVVSWSTLLVGYAQHGCAQECLQLFEQMQEDGVKPSMIAVVSALNACASRVALKQGKQIHDLIREGDFHANLFVGNALVDMYAKCGKPEVARQVFDLMPERDVVSWNTMIAGYGHNGLGQDALNLFEQMKLQNVKLNHITFLSVLSACNHKGLTDEGCKHFESMTREYGICPTNEHYACLVDLFGRAGRLDEAEQIIDQMPVQPSMAVWMALLAASRIHNNIKLAQRAAKHVIELEPQKASAYVLLANTYAALGQKEEESKVRNLMTERGVRKMPGYTWIELHNQTHQFVAGDKSHPRTEAIYAEVERLSGQMQMAGYVPDAVSELHDAEEEQTEDSACFHSERLAMAFALISSAPGTPIHIVKNIRVCRDCHQATKIISRITGREIIARDPSRFHHVKDGVCTCGDYW